MRSIESLREIAVCSVEEAEYIYMHNLTGGNAGSKIPEQVSIGLLVLYGYCVYIALIIIIVVVILVWC